MVEFLCKKFPESAIDARIPQLLQALKSDIEQKASDEVAEKEATPRGSKKTSAVKTLAETERLQAILGAHPFLCKLPPRVQSKMLEGLVKQKFQPGDLVDLPPHAMLIIESGVVECLHLEEDAGTTVRRRWVEEDLIFDAREILHPNGNLAESERLFRAATEAVVWVLETSAGTHDVLMNDVIPAMAREHSSFYRTLRSSRAFGQLDEEDVSSLAFASSSMTVSTGQVVYDKATSEAKSVSILRAGEAACFNRDAAGQEVEVALLTSGDWFIEDPSAMEHTATVKAKAPADLEVVRVPSEMIIRVVTGAEYIVDDMMVNSAGLAKTVLGDPADAPPAHGIVAALGKSTRRASLPVV
mmetsp:Transcript_10028/g.28538  ORF Transcript_10028/g.28538 Transcript_10028/m.28538 type:complete len:356 (-) Transcript_10028:103-1170(-)